MNETLLELNQTITNSTTEILGYTAPFTNSAVIDIFLITLFTSLFITIVNKYMTDQIKIKALKAEIKKMGKNAREKMKTDPEKARQLQSEIMKKNFENFKYLINPKVILITMIPMLGIFLLVSSLYGPLGKIFNFFNLFEFGWLGTYIVFSLINSIILKKILDVA